MDCSSYPVVAPRSFTSPWQDGPWGCIYIYMCHRGPKKPSNNLFSLNHSFLNVGLEGCWYIYIHIYTPYMECPGSSPLMSRLINQLGECYCLARSSAFAMCTFRAALLRLVRPICIRLRRLLRRLFFRSRCYPRHTHLQFLPSICGKQP